MCGIVGIYNVDASVTRIDALSQSLEALSHRGPDGKGIYEQGAACMGMRRLAIIDVEGGYQPIYNEDRTLAVVFNGEIYN